MRGNGTCTCLPQFIGTSCDACLPPNTNFPHCNASCPGGLPVCSSQGDCTANGTCSCWPGWTGDDCSVSCPGYHVPCSGHGTCARAADPYCQCFSTAAGGSWYGANCSQCSVGYSGRGCNLTCPTGTGGVCSNRGTCREGLCICLLWPKLWINLKSV